MRFSVRLARTTTALVLVVPLLALPARTGNTRHKIAPRQTGLFRSDKSTQLKGAGSPQLLQLQSGDTAGACADGSNSCLADEIEQWGHCRELAAGDNRSHRLYTQLIATRAAMEVSGPPHARCTYSG